MDAALSELNLADDFEDCLEVEDGERWSLKKVGPLEVWMTISPIQDPKESFQARFLWTEYPDKPPSMKFRDPATGRLDMPQAWPIVGGFRPQNCDACVNWTAEGFIAHPNWVNDPTYRWNPHGNRQLFVIRTLRDEMDRSYTGRFKQ